MGGRNFFVLRSFIEPRETFHDCKKHLLNLCSLVLCGACAAGAAGPALAQATTPAQALLANNWVFNLGGFVVNSDLKANLNGQSTQNPEVDFDETVATMRHGSVPIFCGASRRRTTCV